MNMMDELMQARLHAEMSASKETVTLHPYQSKASMGIMRADIADMGTLTVAAPDLSEEEATELLLDLARILSIAGKDSTPIPSFEIVI